jgi:cytochrome P450
VDITSPEFKAGAHATYARLRAQEPVHRVDLPGRRAAWLVTRYDDVVRRLKDERLVKDRRRARGSKPFSRLPGMVPLSSLRWRPGLNLRGLESLSVAW